jgi:hypothetical protein
MDREMIGLVQHTAQCGERILRGTKPGELPVKFELMINQKIAKTMDFAAMHESVIGVILVVSRCAR